MTGQVDFGSHTDAVVETVAGLVNVATPGWRRGAPYEPPTGAALRAALDEAIRAVYPDGRSHARRADAIAEVARRGRPVFEHVQAGDHDAAAKLTNDLLEHYRPTPYLDRHDGQPWHLHFHGTPDTDPSEWGGGMVVALATVLGGEYADRLGVCEAPNCDRVFVDVSRNGTRRFCSTACQNRVKAAAHRARESARAGTPRTP